MRHAGKGGIVRRLGWALDPRVAGIEHELDPQPVPAPLLDLVEVAAVGKERVVGLPVGPIGRALSGHAFKSTWREDRGQMARKPDESHSGTPFCRYWNCDTISVGDYSNGGLSWTNQIP